ncbi:MAG TPA: IclR family transcriptional regulator [Gaiellaceae bacterium]|nr:IclR family transcriptional regulator [Gaiellaceae bacterium]
MKAQVRDNPIRALAKAVHLLEQLADAREATPRRLAELLGEPRTTTYRLLRSLEALDLVEPGSQPGSYHLGWRLWRLGAAVVERLDERQAALPVMERVHARVGETVFLLVRSGWQAVCIERLEGLRVQSLALRLGGSLPLHVGAGPRALLAWEPREVWDEYLLSGQLSMLTERTPVTRDAVLRELDETLRRGYAVSDEDVTLGIASLGAPIFDYTGKVRAALSIGGLKSLVLGEERETFVELVVQGAREISAALGHNAV